MRAINTLLDQDNMDFIIGYEKWLREAFIEAHESELQGMEDTLYKVSTEKNRIVTHRPLNNPNYQPLQGA